MSLLPNLHILGIQGSGKGTQSALLVEQYNLTYASSGNLLRKRASVDDELGKLIASELSLGKLLPNDLLVATIMGFLAESPITSGFLGDGVIRTLDQYRLLQPVWKAFDLDQPVLINLVLDEASALERIKTRQQEQNDPAKYEYHKVYSGKLVHRTDDNPKAIEERFALFKEMTTPVIRQFESDGRCFHVKSEGSIQEIHSTISDIVSANYPQLTNGTH